MRDSHLDINSGARFKPEEKSRRTPKSSYNAALYRRVLAANGITLNRLAVIPKRDSISFVRGGLFPPTIPMT